MQHRVSIVIDLTMFGSVDTPLSVRRGSFHSFVLEISIAAAERQIKMEKNGGENV